MLRHRVDAQAAYVLHTYPFRETSLIVEVFSRDWGRVSLMARGARRPRSALRGLLMAFQPLELGWSGKGEVQTLTKAEWLGGQPLLSGKALFCGYYLNELLLNLLPREDAHERLFSVYAQTLRRFADGLHEADLRRFECALLSELGYGLTLAHDVEGAGISAEASYAYEIERGPVRLAAPGDSPLCVSGRTLIDLAHDDFTDPRSLAEAKPLMRALITHYTGGKGLETRKIFMELQELS
ncbi:DNA repair protein RecO [Rhodocyclus tenuis]|uniref:DNA repair protein RecO n=2 Tax=Rhodocyclus TaxID=1064 RepID=A0A6L5JV02_RHOTE|nr:DNA repair protein RecO [Rhodocyclus gracilis]MQY50871.1 DNA repair protein RecO [Rhodocyclus gracilis]MRD72845.1 DNA repair protein RecO [Rhodocyclus gracilis]NJA90050.1 DNA repair protein RecO [Rhodocyclus gracilis]